MAWTNGTVETATWSSATASGGFTQSASFGKVAWAQVSAQPPATDNGVDFELQAHTTYPMLISADRPLLIVSSLSEGSP